MGSSSTNTKMSAPRLFQSKLLLLVIFCTLCIILTSCEYSNFATSSIKESQLTSINQNMQPESDLLYPNEVCQMVGIVDDDSLSGKDITVAVIDSGVYPHPDLEGKIALFKDFVNNQPEPYDDFGHGTEMCGIIAGSGALGGEVYKGVAPESKLVVLKVADKNGNVNIDTLLEALEWVFNNTHEYNIRVANISLGIVHSNADYEKLAPVIQDLEDVGILVVAPTGNNYNNKGAQILPAAFQTVIAVGCVSETASVKPQECILAGYSNYFQASTGIFKPDVVAPGNRMQVLQSDTTFTGTSNPISMSVSYKTTSGTSNASAIVAGLLAIIIEQHPAYSANAIKNILFDTSVAIAADDNQSGYGLVSFERQGA